MYERALGRERIFRDRKNLLETLNHEEFYKRFRFNRRRILLLTDMLENLEPSTKRNHDVPSYLKIYIHCIIWQPAYVNRTQYHSINVQAVRNYNCKFINVVANKPGRFHDSTVLKVIKQSCTLKYI